MFYLVDSSRLSSPVLEHLAGEIHSYDLPMNANNSNNSNSRSYQIDSIRESEHAWVLFVHEKKTKEHFVLKLLRRYKDTRYSLESAGKRQKCQLEGLRWNKQFTSDIYIGLARLRRFNEHNKTIELDKVMEDPKKSRLDPGYEYVLLMKPLSARWSLDYLLRKKAGDVLKNHIPPLVECLHQMHRWQTEELPIEKPEYWGSYAQLKQKLEHNIGLAHPITNADGRQNPLGLIYAVFRRFFLGDRKRFPGQLKNDFEALGQSLTNIFTEDFFQEYMAPRIEQNRIKRCHGDLKAPNIWITPSGVYVLDAIDFNPDYCYIDVLSDFAMLLVDIQARTGSLKLAACLQEQYLKCTHQQDPISRMVLAYYALEKAYICAAISFVYDNLPALGKAYLAVAQERMIDLQEKVKEQAFKSDEAIEDDSANKSLHSDSLSSPRPRYAPAASYVSDECAV